MCENCYYKRGCKIQLGNHQRLRNIIPLPLAFVVLYFETIIMKICVFSNILSIVFINFSYSLCHIVSNQINFIITFFGIEKWICGAESNRSLHKCWFFHLLLPKCSGPHYPQLQNEGQKYLPHITEMNSKENKYIKMNIWTLKSLASIAFPQKAMTMPPLLHDSSFTLTVTT